jgi:hypothetical protein
MHMVSPSTSLTRKMPLVWNHPTTLPFGSSARYSKRLSQTPSNSTNRLMPFSMRVSQNELILQELELAGSRQAVSPPGGHTIPEGEAGGRMSEQNDGVVWLELAAEPLEKLLVLRGVLLKFPVGDTTLLREEIARGHEERHPIGPIDRHRVADASCSLGERHPCASRWHLNHYDHPGASKYSGSPFCG